MIDKQHLRDKDVAFRIRCVKKIVHGTVRNVENDGFWIVAPELLAELRGEGWTATVGQAENPVLFVPTASLEFLIASDQ
ncbi:MAG: hypothetical protein DMG71_06810 [Acidobacteria bacterium]|nr:MAG: hypothetical protein DMG71_06810 [Acidobacteriota bacterium]